MNRHLLAAAGLAICLSAPRALPAINWISAPSHFTHDPQTGEHATQYAPVGPFFIFPSEYVTKSGYRHRRSSLRVGDSADDLHIVERWGPPVRPYGEWQYP